MREAGTRRAAGLSRFLASGTDAAALPGRGGKKELVEVRLQAADGRAGGARGEGRGGERVAAGRGAGPKGASLAAGSWSRSSLPHAGGCGLDSGRFFRAGRQWARGPEASAPPCALRCRGDLVAAPAGVGGGRQSVVGLRKGSQGALPWEMGGERGEASPREVFAPFLEVSPFRLASPARWAQTTETPAAPRLLGSGFALRRVVGWWDSFVQPQGPRYLLL